MRFFRTALVAAAVFTVAPSAQAQIYTWRDAGGNLVLSDRPQEGGARSFAVGGAAAFRATRAANGRANAYDQLISEHSATHGVRADLVKAVIQAESGFDPSARSIKGAMGLMQLMPATAVEYGVRNPYDPADNIRAGVAYLKSLLRRYAHNEQLALAAYNAGPGAVQKYGNVVPPYRETRNYVAKIQKQAGSRPVTRVYKVVEIQNGREVTRYTNTPPAAVQAADKQR